MSRVLGLVVVALVAVACGGGAVDPSATPDSPSTSQSPSAPDRSDSVVVDAASDLSDFVCEEDSDGEWNASGVITNSSAKSADYRLTVVVSDGPGVSLAGLRRTLTDLSPGSSEPFDVKSIPTSGDADPVCQVEVLRLP